MINIASVALYLAAKPVYTSAAPFDPDPMKKKNPHIAKSISYKKSTISFNCPKS